jgi:hypothetical protein
MQINKGEQGSEAMISISLQAAVKIDEANPIQFWPKYLHEYF